MDRTQERTKAAVKKPPKSWIQDIDDIDRLGKVHAELRAIALSFSCYSERKLSAVAGWEIFGFWYILDEICNELWQVMENGVDQ